VAGTRKITVEVEVPEGLEWIDERILAGMARAALERRLFLLKRLEELVPEPLAAEEEIMKIDRLIKRSLARRLEDELSSSNS
jgi:hypothetical protein